MHIYSTYTHTHTQARKRLMQVNTIPIHNCITAESSLRLSGQPLLQSSLPRWLSIFSPISSQFLPLLFYESLSHPHQRPSQIPHLLSLIILKLIKLLTPHADPAAHMQHTSNKLAECIFHSHIYISFWWTSLFCGIFSTSLLLFTTFLTVSFLFIHSSRSFHGKSLPPPFLQCLSRYSLNRHCFLCCCKRSLLSEILIWQAR